MNGLYLYACSLGAIIVLFISDFDFIRKFGIDTADKRAGIKKIRGSNKHQVAYAISRRAKLQLPTRTIFISGLPRVFSFMTTFRRIPKYANDTWSLIEIRDASQRLQFGLRFYDTEPKRRVTVYFPAAKNTVQTLIFTKVDQFFSRRWRTIHLAVDYNKVSLYLNCKLVQSLPMVQWGSISLNGKTFLSTRHLSRSTVRLQLQWMSLHCDPTRPARSTCRELRLGWKTSSNITHTTQTLKLATVALKPSLYKTTGPTDHWQKHSRPTLLTMSKGAKGDSGLIGPKGEPGVKGETGSKGSRGIQGPQGKDGSNGQKGSKGDPGEPADPGFGLKNLTLLVQDMVGPPGPAGAKGNKGEAGEQGIPGVHGQSGHNGIQGIKGDKGEDGPPGVKGEPADAGSSVHNLTHLLQEMVGPPGSQGAKGDKGEAGERGLPGSRGQNGNDGIQGIKGDKGADGSPGIKGDYGEIGPEGKSGPQGPLGRPGSAGLPGVKGDKGSAGSQGAKGQPGAPGKDGSSGPPGERGFIGPMGHVGLPGRQGLPGPPGEPGLAAERQEYSEVKEILKPGPPGPQGPRGPTGMPGERGSAGQRGYRGYSGYRGSPGRPGGQGAQGPQGVRGQPGMPGMPGPPGRGFTENQVVDIVKRILEERTDELLEQIQTSPHRQNVGNTDHRGLSGRSEAVSRSRRDVGHMNDKLEDLLKQLRAIKVYCRSKRNRRPGNGGSVWTHHKRRLQNADRKDHAGLARNIGPRAGCCLPCDVFV